MIVLKGSILLIFVIIIHVHAGPMVKRSDFGQTSSIQSSKKGTDINNSNHASLPSMYDPMSLVTFSGSNDHDNDNDDGNVYQVNKDPVLHHHSLYIAGGEGQRSKNNLKYGVTNIGSRQHRYGEGIWSPKSDQTASIQHQQEKNNDNNNANNYNNKSVPRRKEKSLTGIENQGHLVDPVPPSSSTKESEDNIVALDKHGQLHTLALPMTILPAP